MKRQGRYSYSTNIHNNHEVRTPKDSAVSEEKIVHFGSKLHFRDRNKYLMSRDTYIHGDSHKSSFDYSTIYSEERFQEFCKNALINFDINMERFNSIETTDFENELDFFLQKIRESGYDIHEVLDLKDASYCGTYIMVLGQYKQIYIGASKNICDRIKKHWQNNKPIDRLVFGSVQDSKIAIDCFKALDTTKIFAIRTSSDIEAFQIEEIIDKWISNDFLLNRVWGGRPEGAVETFAKLLSARRCVDSLEKEKGKDSD